MRELLFRGKRMDNGEWVDGNLFLSDTDGSAYILAGNRIITIEWEVDPSTVGQYTGLTDKHGNRIFEGDIMAFVAYGFDYVGSVEIVDGNASVMCKHASPFLDQAVSKHGAYIIGNIHDNPELLEED